MLRTKREILSRNQIKKEPTHDNKELEHIYQIMKRLNSTHDLSQVAQDILIIMIKALDCIGGALFVVNEEQNTLKPFAYSKTSLFLNKIIPLLTKPFEDHLFDLSQPQNLTARTATEKKAFLSLQYENFMESVIPKRISIAIQKMLKMKATITVPAIVKGKVMGVLMIGFREAVLSDKKRRLIDFVADQCAIALNNAQKYERLQDQYQKVQNVLAQQSDFISNSCHEFRTPLTTALFEAQALTDSLKENPVPGIYAKSLSVMNSLKKLHQITQKIFDVQAHDAKQVYLRPHTFSLNIFCNYIDHRFRSAMKKKGLKWRVKTEFKKELWVYMDQDLIEKLLSELIYNAMQFTPPRGQITLQIKKNSDHYSFKVIDNGEGIPQQERENVFKKFKGNHGMQSVGIGLGLYISKKIVELHHGKIWAEETKKGGATITVKIPKS